MVNLAAAVSPELLRRFRQPADLVAHQWQAAGLHAPPELNTAQWHGTGPLSRRSRAVAGHRVMLVGDAAGYVEPFTGEGVAAAISGAIAAADLIGKSPGQWTPGTQAAWTLTYRRLIAQRQWLCSGLTAALHRPWMAQLLFRIGAAFSQPAAPGRPTIELVRPAVVRTTACLLFHVRAATPSAPQRSSASGRLGEIRLREVHPSGLEPLTFGSVVEPVRPEKTPQFPRNLPFLVPGGPMASRYIPLRELAANCGTGRRADASRAGNYRRHLGDRRRWSVSVSGSTPRSSRNDRLGSIVRLIAATKPARSPQSRNMVD